MKVANTREGSTFFSERTHINQLMIHSTKKIIRHRERFIKKKVLGGWASAENEVFLISFSFFPADISICSFL